jgi:hypothetical protein
MYEEHSVFERPEDENARIWRYLDFTKFVSVLDREALFFARADVLPDAFEGSHSRANVALRPILHGGVPAKAKKNFLDTLTTIYREMRRFTFLNCWHLNEHESAAMWRLYLKTEEGVAIQSTFRRLADSFTRCREHTIHIGKVRYIDYDTELMPAEDIRQPFLHKRKSFEHERELRAVIQEVPHEEGKGPPWLSPETGEVGVYVPVDLEVLIERVYVSPTAPEWFSELVASVAKKYQLNKELAQSSLRDGPVY